MSLETGRRWGWKIKTFFSHNAIGVACVCVCECVWGTDSLWWGPPLQDTVKLVFLKYYFNLNMYKREKKLFRKKKSIYQPCLFQCRSMAISSSSIIQSLNRMLSRLSLRLWNHNQMCCFPPEVSAPWRRFYCHFFVHTVEWQVDEIQRG